MISRLRVRLPPEGSFGRWAKCQLEDWFASGTVRFGAYFKEYARLLVVIYYYLTRPFVVSWSLLDAMASGCCLVASDVETVRDGNPEGTIWVDHRDPNDLIKGLGKAFSMVRTREISEADSNVNQL